MVATPHWGDSSLSIDLTSDEISVTGGHQRFALERFALLVSVRKRTRTAGGIPSCPGLIPATSIDVAPHCGDHLFRLTSEPMRCPPLEVIGSSPRSPLKTVHWTVFQAFRTHGAYSLSIDLRFDEISATGSHQIFAPNHRFGQLLNN